MDKELLRGVVDMHFHTAPDLRPRRYDDLSLCDAMVAAGARAVVLKSHLGDTSARACLVNHYCREKYPESDFQAVGSINMNRCVGGINPAAVENALALGAKVVWLPTASARNHLEKLGKPTDECVDVVQDGQVLPELRKVLELVREYDAVLATGHLSGAEIDIVVRTARAQGVEKIVVTHPEWWLVGLSLSEQQRLVKEYDVILERCFAQNKGVGAGHGYLSNLPGNLEAIRAIGYRNILISTDGGQLENAPWEEMEGQYLRYLLNHDIPLDEIQYMSKKLPKQLLNL